MEKECRILAQLLHFNHFLTHFSGRSENFAAKVVRRKKLTSCPELHTSLVVISLHYRCQLGSPYRLASS